MRRHELTDEQWALVEGFFPEQARGGKWGDHRALFNGVIWRLRTGAPWRAVPDRCGKWQTVYGRFRRLRRAGLLDRMIEALQQRLDAAGLIETDLWCIDGTNVRASRSAAGAPEKKSRASPATTPWAGPAAASGPRSTWSATAAGCRWRRR